MGPPVIEPDVRDHLSRELESPDPWRLRSNPFERARYDAMLTQLTGPVPFARALEVGCADGIFTERLLPHCDKLVVVDVMPSAIERARHRVPSVRVTWATASIAEFEDSSGFDLVVLAEVLYYLRDPMQFRRAVRATIKSLRPGGVLVFCSARDALCERWGLGGGAESAIRLFAVELDEIAQSVVRGPSPDEDCLVTSFVRP